MFFLKNLPSNYNFLNSNKCYSSYLDLQGKSNFSLEFAKQNQFLKEKSNRNQKFELQNSTSKYICCEYYNIGTIGYSINTNEFEINKKEFPFIVIGNIVYITKVNNRNFKIRNNMLYIFGYGIKFDFYSNTATFIISGINIVYTYFNLKSIKNKYYISNFKVINNRIIFDYEDLYYYQFDLPIVIPGYEYIYVDVYNNYSNNEVVPVVYYYKDKYVYDINGNILGIYF